MGFAPAPNAAIANLFHGVASDQAIHFGRYSRCGRPRSALQPADDGFHRACLFAEAVDCAIADFFGPHWNPAGVIEFGIKSLSSAMAERSRDYREYATKCLALARRTQDPRVRAELVLMAKKWIELADEPLGCEFDAVLAGFNEHQMIVRMGAD